MLLLQVGLGLTRFAVSSGLADYVDARLRALDSLATIAIELARPGEIRGIIVSPETICQGIYARGTRGLAAGRRARPWSSTGSPARCSWCLASVLPSSSVPRYYTAGQSG